MTLRSRIAPTPSGFLHTGNACNFLLTYQKVKEAGGSLRLRIDDLDAARIKPEYVQDVFETLGWLGVRWDEGPRNVREHYLEYSQQLRTGRYHQLIDMLVNKGLAYACDCSRKKTGQSGNDGQYPGTCRHKGIPPATPGTAIRIIVPGDTVVQFEDEAMGTVSIDLHSVMPDFIIRRKDGIPAYQIASLADDLGYGINYIVRGADLLQSTAAQLFLADLLGEHSFSHVRFHHHPLCEDHRGHKLSKSAGSRSVRAMRQAGYSRDEILRIIKDW